jgi:hypothetical protein
MSSFKEMSAEVVRKALEGHEDILTPENMKEEAFFRHASCPACGGQNHSPTIDPVRPFSPHSPLPQKNLVCLACQTSFNPRTGLILKSAPGQVDAFTEG